ncbi:hypothetical protein ABFU82_25615 [Nocardioides sp. WV_118_6]
MDEKLPPRPEPATEPPEPPPGGPNRIEGVGGDGAFSTESRDLDLDLDLGLDDQRRSETAPDEESPA